MKRPKLAGVFLLLGGLLAYLMFVKRHYGASEPDAHRPPPPPRLAPGRNSQYGIMFDAGSTGTRIHVFEFQMQRNEAPKLAHETFRAIEPGLSAYADQPQECAAGLVELLKVAESTVPPSSWTRTPVILKATAGLRLLDGEKAEQLLDTVRALFTDSPFLSTEDSVSIMDGTDEGISAWITVNFLTGGLHSADSSTAGMLDLGGGSTQITFCPQDEKTIQTSPMDNIRSFRVFNSTYTVYTHSYLGLGLMSARLSVLGGIKAPPPGGSVELLSPCLAAESSGSWEHADVLYTVRGQKAGEPVYEACRTKVEKVLYRKVVPVAEAADVDFYAFSYYYDRAVDLGVIGTISTPMIPTTLTSIIKQTGREQVLMEPCCRCRGEDGRNHSSGRLHESSQTSVQQSPPSESVPLPGPGLHLSPAAGARLPPQQTVQAGEDHQSGGNQLGSGSNFSLH